MAAPTILVRKLDPTTWDPIRGAGSDNFLADGEAVAQILKQRLLFLQGEWFMSLTDGTPLFQSILGHPNTIGAVSLIIRNRILTTPYVRGILAFNTRYDGANRAYYFNALVSTQFGTITIGNTK